jgi:Tat protein translocase TatB subunit
MFGIGGGELIIILIIAFVLIGPDKFPEIAKSFGKSMRTFKDTGSEIKKTIYEEVKKSDLDNLTIITDLQADIKKATKDLNPINEIKKMTYEMNPLNDLKNVTKDINLNKIEQDLTNIDNNVDTKPKNSDNIS